MPETKFLMETIYDTNLFEFSETLTAMDDFSHTLINTNLLAFFYKFDKGAYLSNYAIPSDVHIDRAHL